MDSKCCTNKLVLDVTINIVLDNVVWSLSKKGIDFGCPTILLSTLGAYACVLQDSLDRNLADLDTTQNDSIDFVTDDVSIPLEMKQP